MKNVYLLVPLLITQSTQNLKQHVEKTLNVPHHTFQIHELNKNNYCVEVAHFNLCFTEIEQVFKEYEELKKKLALFEDVIDEYNASGQRSKINVNESVNIEGLLKKVKKFKEIKDQNKKLKKLLQIQCENSEKIREQTQKTVKILKQQVNALVQQVHAKQSKGPKEKEKKNKKQEIIDL